MPHRIPSENKRPTRDRLRLTRALTWIVCFRWSKRQRRRSNSTRSAPLDRSRAWLPIDFNRMTLDSLAWGGRVSSMKGELAMGLKLEIIDIGDAIQETKQWAPVGMMWDNAAAWGQWY